MRGRFAWLIVVGVLGCAAAAGWFLFQERNQPPEVAKLSRSPSHPPPDGTQQATFGGGCFWCTQVLFQQLNGVHSTVSGYSGGAMPNPTYEQVCAGTTGHAEAVQITYDPAVISYDELLEVFWRTHDPTTRNRQGHDVGPQYRSVIFYHNADQQKLAESYKQKLDASGAFDGPIVTDIVPFTAFYPAENYHQNYYVDHARQPYCATIIGPKLDKFEKVFADKLKPELRGER
ncbi:MAG TPA: peptide-methionine (S)-S-oxide reductase MsrA [Gemmataceae bacterium]|nr:peptide-methionine (S)-S-oxide reductase MsrA [Gemmataceae bacterium]